MRTHLSDLTQWAKLAPQSRYNALMGVLSNPEGMHASFHAQAGNKAAGIDGVSNADYAQEVDARLAMQSTELRKLSWQPLCTLANRMLNFGGSQWLHFVPSGTNCFKNRNVDRRPIDVCLHSEIACADSPQVRLINWI